MISLKKSLALVLAISPVCILSSSLIATETEQENETKLLTRNKNEFFDIKKINLVDCPDLFKDSIAYDANKNNVLRTILAAFIANNPEHVFNDSNKFGPLKIMEESSTYKRIFDNREGRISNIKAFPSWYKILDANNKYVIVNNDSTNPSFVEMFEIRGFKKVEPTAFIDNLTIPVKEFKLNFSKYLPSNLNFLDLLSSITNQDCKRVIKMFLHSAGSDILNLYKNFNSNDVVLDTSFPVENNNKDGTKKIKLKIIGNYFDQNYNVVSKTSQLDTAISSGIITLTGFASDLLGNGKPITDTTNTTITLAESIPIDNKNILASQFFNTKANMQEVRDFIDKRINILNGFDYGNYNIDAVKEDDFTGEIRIDISLDKYIKNGKVVNEKLKKHTILSGFGQDLLGNNKVTGSNVNTTFVCGTNISLDSVYKLLPSEYSAESLIKELNKIEILNNAIKGQNQNFSVQILNKNDEKGLLEIKMYVNSYILNGKIVNQKLIQNATIVGFKAFAYSNKINDIIIYSVVGSLAALLLLGGAGFYFARKYHSKNMLAYENYLIDNNIARPANLKSYLPYKKPWFKIRSKNAEVLKKSLTLPNKIEDNNKIIPKIDSNNKTYEEYYTPENKEAIQEKKDMDDIFLNLTMDFGKEEKFEDTIDRLMNEIDED